MKNNLIKLFADSDIEIYFIYEEHYNCILYFGLDMERTYAEDPYTWSYSDLDNFEFIIPKYFSFEACYHIINKLIENFHNDKRNILCYLFKLFDRKKMSSGDRSFWKKVLSGERTYEYIVIDCTKENS